MADEPADEKVCWYFRSTGNCRRGDACPYEHVRFTDASTEKRFGLCVNESEHTVMMPAEESWVAVEITAICNPKRFYVYFPFGPKPVRDLMREDSMASPQDEGYEGSATTMCESMERLHENMQDHYSRLPLRDTDLALYALGEIVAACFSKDQRWYRARVVDTDPDNMRLKLFYVDYGHTEWRNESDVRQMMPHFLNVPLQAVQCFLPIEPATSDSAWTQKANDMFKDQTDGKVLFAHILTRSGNELEIELYDTTATEINLSQLLVDQGHARHTKKQPGSASIITTSQAQSSASSVKSAAMYWPG